MKYIHKIISLENLKARCSNTLVSFEGNKYLFPSNELFFFENPNGTFNSFPSDIILPKEFSFSSSTIPSYIRNFDFSNITELTNTSVNVFKNYENYNLIDEKDFYLIKKYSDGYISYDEKGNKINILTYKKLHKWYNFFIFYFRLLHTTTCGNSDKVYYSAEEYYYSDNEKNENETLEYFQELDKTFIKRGGKIKDGDKGTHCDLYEWMRDFIFITYDLKTSYYINENENGKKYPLKEYISEWKNTILNINSLMYWYSWFKLRYTYFSGTTDCSSLDYEKIKIFNCCDCQEYQRLGGDIMYMFLKENKELYFEKAKAIEKYCTKTAEINIPLQIQTYNKNVGELTMLADEWEDGVNLSTYGSNITPTSSAVIHYGGNSFYSYDGNNNNIISVQDSIFYNTDSNLPSYKTSEYSENYFIDEEKIINGYKEYLPEYIEKNKDEFIIKDNDGLTAYSYNKKNSFVRNPTIENMSINYKVIMPSSKKHLYYINGKIYESNFKKVLVDYNGEIVSGNNNNPYFIEYVDNNENLIPYFEYNGNKIFGIYNNDTYVFSIKKLPTHKWDWFYMSTDYYEYIVYNSDIYYVDKENNNKVTVSFNKQKVYSSYPYLLKINFSPIDGYILDDNEEDIAAFICHSGSPSTYFCALEKSSSTKDGIIEITYEPNNDTKFKTFISNIEDWKNDKKGYWIINDNDKLILHYIEPYVSYAYGYVIGKVRSRLNELEDFAKSHDKLGNILDGIYCGESLIPQDTEILDFTYHVGNVSDITYIMSAKCDTEIVYEEKKSVYVDYYWGNLISNIEFYFKDENDDIINDTIVNAPNVYNKKEDMKIINNNLNCISSSLTKYFEYKYDKITDIKEVAKISEGTLIVSGDNICKVESITYNKSEPPCAVVETYSSYETLKDKYSLLENKMYCKIHYNIGAIIERPYAINAESNSNKYVYGLYKLSNKYHKGVEYEEEYIIDIKSSCYYDDEDHFFNINSFILTPTEEITYYLDNEPDEESDEFTANTAYFKMETIPNFTSTCDGEKYTSGLNTSLSDGRQFNFYNGLMASPSFTEEYNLGTTSLRNVNDNIYIDRGINYALDKHIKLLEVKSFEALEQYGNGFFNIIDNNN